MKSPFVASPIGGLAGAANLPDDLGARHRARSVFAGALATKVRRVRQPILGCGRIRTHTAQERWVASASESYRLSRCATHGSGSYNYHFYGHFHDPSCRGPRAPQDLRQNRLTDGFGDALVAGLAARLADGLAIGLSRAEWGWLALARC
jgi:hypothetical protein